MGRDKQQQQQQQQQRKANKERKNSKTVAGKVSLSDLVSAGLLQAGSVVVCNSWPFSAIVSATGRLDARWTPIPSEFAQPVAGSEFMRAEFDTPSAWATAVCRVMRAQQARATNGESRVAVNGWTACRVQVPKDNEASPDKAVEITLDTLRREFTARQTLDSDESSSAVDGLAQQVAQGLALGCVSQRRAAAAATTAMAASPKRGCSAHDSRKRKSIPDMSRHAKLSRVPTTESSDSEIDDGFVRQTLDTYQAVADACPRDERKALRVRRRQSLRQAIAAATGMWLDARRKARATTPPTEHQHNVAATLVPCSAPSLPRLCVACSSAGTALHGCRVCGDSYHGFCMPPTVAAAVTAGDRQFVCPACSVCATCLVADASDLLSCDTCGLSTHAQCSRQKQRHSGGRWLCDSCVRCLECGFTMSEEATDWDTRASWAYDSNVCGHCAAQIERARVCPECVATYADAASASTMVCCDVCAMWVHAACDPLLTPLVYDTLTSREDAAYVCPTCVRPSSSTSPSLSCLPRCLRAVTTGSAVSLKRESVHLEEPAAGVEAEAANLLLSLTQSDIRFDHERFALDYLQARFCQASSVFGDTSRRCALCGLCGDGIIGLAQQLGRLIPFGSNNQMPASLWAHVECLAWAWGPRSVEVSRGLVRFEGTLMDNNTVSPPQLCALCTRAGPTFHCCAPVPCTDSAYHLPCLLVAATTTHSEIQYSAAWRRALCPAHAPKYSSMMPMDDPAIQPPSFADICVQSHVPFASPLDPVADCFFTRIGNLLVLAWGSDSDTAAITNEQPPPNGLYVVRYFTLDSRPYTLGLQALSDPSPMWRGWISPGLLAPSALSISMEPPSDTVATSFLLSDLLTQLLGQHQHKELVADLAIAYPLRFLGLDRYPSSPALQAVPGSPIPLPANSLHLHSHTFNESTSN